MLGKYSTERKVPTSVFFTNVDGTNAAGAAADYSMSIRDRIVYVYESNGLVQAAYAITLPTVSEAAGLTFTFLAVEDLSTYNVTVQDQGESFGWTDFIMRSDKDKLTLYSDGFKWHVIADEVSSSLYEKLITTYQVLRSDDRRTFLLDLAAGFVITLPTVASVNPGFRVRFVVKEPPSGGAYDVTAEGAIAVVGIKELPVTTGTDGIQSTGCTTITFADGVAILGDWIDLVTDGTSWFVIGHVATTLAITLA